MIPYSRQWISDADIESVVKTLKSDFLAQGPVVPEFESAIAKAVDAKFVTMTNSATSALHVACLALGVGPGDRVWTSPMSFVASANCAKYCGAEVDFVDIDVDTGNMSVTCLQAKLAECEKSGELPKVIIPVHFAGQSCDMKAIAEVCEPYGIRIIEDASHALGGAYQGSPVGSCEYSDITVFSFHPVKMITSAEGGCLVTNDEPLDSQIKLLMNHGITKKNEEFISTHSEPWYYEQQLLGFNFRMTEIQAALGLSQLSKLQEWVSVRNDLISDYKIATADLPITWLQLINNIQCSYHLAVIKVDPEIRLDLFNYLRQNDVGVQVHYIPIYRQPYYNLDAGHWPAAESFYEQIISLPLYPRLTKGEQASVVQLLEGFFK